MKKSSTMVFILSPSDLIILTSEEPAGPMDDKHRNPLARIIQSYSFLIIGALNQYRSCLARLKKYQD